MEHYVGLDVSLKETQICVVDSSDAVVGRSREVTRPDLLARAIGKLCPAPKRVVLETGGQSSWLAQGLVAEGLAVDIVDARKAKLVLSMQLNKTDVNDAEGLARLAKIGWYRAVAVKPVEARLQRAVLLARRQLVKQRRDMENQARALLRGFGLGVGTVSHAGFEDRIWELLARDASLSAALSLALEPLMGVHRVLGEQIGRLTRELRRMAAACPVCRRLMSVPGVGPLTALSFVTALGDPYRFAKSASVGVYLGLTPRRYQSAEVSWSGRISKRGDALAREMLYEAANSLLTRVKRWSAPKAWAARLVKKTDGKKARVALARKLAVILHRIWVDGSEFRWSKQTLAA